MAAGRFSGGLGASVARAGSALALGAAALLGGCAGFRSERHMAPLFSELSTAGGGTEQEAVGGAVRVRRARPGGLVSQWAVRPIVIRDQKAGDDFLMRFLTPFGRAERNGADFGWYLLPVTLYNRQEHAGAPSEYTLITLPGIYWSRTADGRTLRAWFPFGGVFERFLSFDRLEFVLFPLWARSQRAGRTTNHVLWPFFSRTTGAGGPSWRVWPLVGNDIYAGRHENWFALWPVFQWGHDRLWAPPQGQERRWMVFPLYGETRRGHYQSHTLLWPFFGWARDPDTEFWAWDGPWPLIRFERDPEHDTSRTRLWPLYSNYHGDGLDSTWVLWPIVNLRHEEYEHAHKDAFHVLPFWQSWQRQDDETGRSSWCRLWPLYQIDQPEQGRTRVAFPSLNPLWRTQEIEDMYAWIWELYARETDKEKVRERSWLGLYRREKDADEDRRSLAFLWAQRDWRDGQDRRVTDHSLLLGLIRWRTREDGMLRGLPPALPGPGWPLERSPRKKAP
jgi:hypothetical protein